MLMELRVEPTPTQFPAIIQSGKKSGKYFSRYVFGYEIAVSQQSDRFFESFGSQAVNLSFDGRVNFSQGSKTVVAPLVLQLGKLMKALQK